MTETLEQTICRFTGADCAECGPLLQQLWSGYGAIVRYTLTGCEQRSVVVKKIAVPEQVAHPRGWHSDVAHARKLRSYAVEAEWYRRYAHHCRSDCRVAECYGVQGAGVGCAMVLQDLDACGFDVRLQRASTAAAQTVIAWLANFHAQWLGHSSQSLWERGSYWHLTTRADEWEAMPAGALKTNAGALDAALANAEFKTLLHGDAKIANFCFNKSHREVAAVDFQYVGVGVGVVDLAYFLGSCLSGPELMQLGEQLLQLYLRHLGEALALHGKLDSNSIAALLQEWRGLYPVAWADFERFLQGWSPGHPKLNAYSAQLSNMALDQLQGN